MAGERRSRHRSSSSRSQRPRASVPRATVSRALWLVAVVLVAGWLGWQIVGNTIADTRRNPEAALAWQTDHPGQLVALAEERLISADEPDELAEVKAIAEQALAVAPLNQGALRALALASDLSGDATADGLMDLAGARAPREPLTQIWLLDRDLAAGNFSTAIDHFDRILRTRPDLGQQMSPVAGALAAGDAGELVARLNQNPPWRRWILEMLGRNAPAQSNFAVLDALAEGQAPPSGTELRPFLDRLVADGEPELAYLTWMHFRPDADSDETPYIANGSFEQASSGVPFDWTFAPVRGAQTVVASSEGRRALRVTFSGTRVPYSHTRQLLMLPPGSYVLGGEGRPLNLDTARGVSWRLRCNGKEPIGRSEIFVGTAEWRSFELAFKVPATRCGSQLLQLELDARVVSEQMVSGEVWFDNLTIERAEVAAGN